MNGLSGKIAIVTGGNSGIGLATVQAMVAAGTKVVIADIADSSKTVEDIKKAGGDAMFVRTDVSKSSDIQALVKKTVETYGQLDFAVNNAGILGKVATTGDYPEEDWNRVIGINLTGVWLCMKYELEQMLEQGHGAIVNTASILGRVGFATFPAYVAAKHGVIGLTKTSAIEYATQNIRINAICPGFIYTPLLAGEGMVEGSDAYSEIANLHPMKRMGKPEEVANLVLWLCSEGASFVTGGDYLVDGGYVAQ